MYITLAHWHSAFISIIFKIDGYHDMDRQAARCQCVWLYTAEAQESPDDANRGVRWWQLAQNHGTQVPRRRQQLCWSHWQISSTPIFFSFVSWTIGRHIHSTHSTWWSLVLETAASPALQFPKGVQLWPLKELSKNIKWPDIMWYWIGEWVVFLEVCLMAGLDYFSNA